MESLKSLLLWSNYSEHSFNFFIHSAFRDKVQLENNGMEITYKSWSLEQCL